LAAYGVGSYSAWVVGLIAALPTGNYKLNVIRDLKTELNAIRDLKN
jgi:hypothetical protein